MKKVAVLGSTGSIGRSALDVISAFPDRFRAVALAAGRSVERLADQISVHRPELVSVSGPAEAERLKALLPAGSSVRIVHGGEGVGEGASVALPGVGVG